MILTAKISTPLIQPGSSDTPMALGIGIAIALLSAALSSLGVNLQALGLSRQRQALQSDENIQTHIPISAHSFDPNNALISTNQFVEPTNGTLLPSPSPVNASDKLFTVVVAGDPRADQQASRPSDEEIETQPLLTPLSSHTISFSPLPPQSFSASGNLSEDSLSEPCSCLSYLRIHWIWYLGFSIYILCEMFGSIFALAYISPVLLAPLGAAGPIFNIIFSRLFLGSLIGIWDIIGTTLIVGGCSIVSIFSSKLPDGGKTLEDLIANFSRPTVAVYFIVQASLLVALFLGIKLLEYSQRIQKLAGYIMSSSSDFETPIVPEEEMLASPLSLAASARSLAGSIAPKQFPQLIGIMYCVLGGAAASETLLLTKAG